MAYPVSPEELTAFINVPSLNLIGFRKEAHATPLKSHINPGFELTYSFKGTFTWQLEEGTRLQINPGEWCITPYYSKHKGAYDTIAPGELFFFVLNFQGTPDILLPTEKVQEDVSKRFSALSNRIHKGNTLLGAQFQRLKELCTQLEDTDLYRHTLITILQDTIFQLASFPEHESESVTGVWPRIKHYIDNNFTEEIQVDHICGRFGISRSRLYQIMESHIGLSPASYIEKLRIEKAVTLLRQTDKLITEIAMDCGFSSSQYFARRLLKFTGHTPKQIRAAYGKS